MKMAPVRFPFCRRNIGRFGRGGGLTEKNETEAEHFSVGFSAGFSVKPANKTF